MKKIIHPKCSAKRAHRNDLESKVVTRGRGKAQTTLPEGKIGGDDAIFVLSEATNPQHSKPM